VRLGEEGLTEGDNVRVREPPVVGDLARDVLSVEAVAERDELDRDLLAGRAVARVDDRAKGTCGLQRVGG
jgi:hypothetical protein